MNETELSANEIEALVLKAARGGGLPLGWAEDLAMACAFLDLGDLQTCPCHSGASATIPTAIDRVAAGEGAQAVIADPALIAAYVAVVEQQSGKAFTWQADETGATLCALEDTKLMPNIPKGRRKVSRTLMDHLIEMAAKTLVPETEESRNSGAGAGLDDND